MLLWSQGESLEKSSGCLDWYLWGNLWAETTELPSDKGGLASSRNSMRHLSVWCLTGCLEVLQIVLRVRATAVFSLGRGKCGQLLPCKPVVGTSRNRRFLKVSLWLIPSVFQGEDFPCVSALAVSLQRKSTPRLLVFSTFLSQKWVILSNRNLLLPGCTLSISEWDPKFTCFL